MSVKTILIAHRQAAIRDRFAAALADARHAFVTADSEAAVFAAFYKSSEPISLVLVDLGLHRLQLVGLAAHQHHVRAQRGEFVRAAAADARAAAGDDEHLACEQVRRED